MVHSRCGLYNELYQGAMISFKRQIDDIFLKNGIFLVLLPLRRKGRMIDQHLYTRYIKHIHSINVIFFETQNVCIYVLYTTVFVTEYNSCNYRL